MKFYKIVDGLLQSGSGSKLPDNTWNDWSTLQVDEKGEAYKYYNADGTPDFARINSDSLKVAKTKKLNELLNAFNQEVSVITQNAPSNEIDSWKKQEDEARALIADINTPTPLIDTMVVSRGLGETRTELADKIIANADAWATAYGAVLGKYQAKVKEVNAKLKVSTVEAITW